MFLNREEQSLFEVKTGNTEDAVFDSAGLLRRCSGSRDLAAETLHLFTESFTALVKTMKEAYSNEDPLSIADTAHSIKGAALNTGAPEIAAAAGAIETHVSSEAPSSLPSLLAQIENMFNRFKEAAQEYLKQAN
jgi:HPt (histidine-containing phosphotransfer) domain-containing protein